IDGPAGAGKSSVAKLVAKKLSYIYIDTGAMYRSLTWIALRKHIDLENGLKLRELLEKTEIQLMPEEKVFLNGEDITAEIRTDEVNNHVSIVAKHKEVRDEMVSRQQLLAKSG